MVFNSQLYEHTDGVAIGSPLGPLGKVHLIWQGGGGMKIFLDTRRGALKKLLR